ncbi:TolC family protein [Desulfonema magnum]|uniref:Outer membrane efflux protein domain-containing protein n=1 Tax=Desulfonema magnum TaxID=45655 RepID=A0A975BLL9_9BACT|nr:TolC family protein [Desulfonema magnum]QTA87847.1 Outer membrane efflux protein domain-containing protein [Desulfonema magnum]
MMKKMYAEWVILMWVSLFMLNGCVSFYQMDLKGQRQVNLAKDLELLHPKAEVAVPDPLTLDHAIKIGLQNNLEMRISRIMAEISDDNALAEKLKMFPQLDFQGNVSGSSAYSAADEDKTRITASLSLTWNILDFGLSYIRSRQAAVQTEIQRMERLRQAQLLALEISSAYWQAVLAEQSLEQIRTLEAEVMDYKKKAEALVSQKRLDPISSKAIEKKIVELAITASDLQAEISGAKITLCELMGLGPATEFHLAKEKFETYLEKMPGPDSLDPRKLEMISLNNRPEFFAADLEMQVQQDEALAALVSMFPGIQFYFSNYYNADSHYVNNFWAAWGSSLTSSLLSLPSRYVQWQSQGKSVDKVKLQRLLLTAGVIVQAHLALHEYKVKERQFRLHEDSFLIAEDLLFMSRERHELGLLSSWAMTQRMLEDVVARLARDRKIIDLINAYNTLLVTMGLDYNRWGENVLEIDENGQPADIEERDIDIPGEEKDMFTPLPDLVSSILIS